MYALHAYIQVGSIQHVGSCTPYIHTVGNMMYTCLRKHVGIWAYNLHNLKAYRHIHAGIGPSTYVHTPQNACLPIQTYTQLPIGLVRPICPYDLSIDLDLEGMVHHVRSTCLHTVGM